MRTLIVVLRSLLVLLALAALWQTAHRVLALEAARRIPGVEGARQAVEWDGDNPEFHARLARYRQSRLDALDLAAAGRDWERALELNPHYWLYWLEYGRHLEMAGRAEEAEAALGRAIRLSPRNARYRWALANFHVRQGDLEQARPALRAALQLDDTYLAPTAQLLLSLGVSVEALDSVWPDRARARWLLFEFLLGNWDRATAVWGPEVFDRQWEQLLSKEPAEGGPEPWQLTPYLQLLLEQGRPAQARAGWQALMKWLGHVEPDFSSGAEAVWNGGFERDPAGEPFDWQVQTAPAFEIRFARREGVGGSAALRVRFPGRQNPEFRQLRQTIVVQPGLAHWLEFWARTENFRSDGEFRWEVRDPAREWAVAGPPVGQTRGWERFAVRFAPPAASRVLEIRLQGRPAGRSLHRLDAVLWVDGVSVRPAEQD